MDTVETIDVTVTRVPGRPQEVTLNGSRTVAIAIEASGKTLDGYNVQVNGSSATVETVLSNGDRVVLVKPIRGNVA